MSPAKYQQIADELRAAIHRGDYRPGDPLPSESQLRGTYDVSRPTVRHAVAILRTEGCSTWSMAAARSYAADR